MACSHTLLLLSCLGTCTARRTYECLEGGRAHNVCGAHFTAAAAAAAAADGLQRRCHISLAEVSPFRLLLHQLQDGSGSALSPCPCQPLVQLIGGLLLRQALAGGQRVGGGVCRGLGGGCPTSCARQQWTCRAVSSHQLVCWPACRGRYRRARRTASGCRGAGPCASCGRSCSPDGRC